MAVVSREALRSPETFDAWLDALGRAIDALPDGDRPPCPHCGRYDLQLEFVADRASRIGMCAFWSEFCGHGIRVSRVAVPEGVPFLPTDAPARALADQIPAFIEIGPSGPVLDTEPRDAASAGPRIVRLLRRHGSLTRSQIAHELGLSATTVARHLRELGETGSVTATRAGRSSRYDASSLHRR